MKKDGFTGWISNSSLRKYGLPQIKCAPKSKRMNIRITYLALSFTSIYLIKKSNSWRKMTMTTNFWKPYQKKMMKRLSGFKRILATLLPIKTSFLLGSLWVRTLMFQMSVMRSLRSAGWFPTRTKRCLIKYLTLCKRVFPNLAIAPVHKQKQSAGFWRW